MIDFIDESQADDDLLDKIVGALSDIKKQQQLEQHDHANRSQYEKRFAHEKAKKILDKSELDTKENLKAILKTVQDGVLEKLKTLLPNLTSADAKDFKIGLPQDVQQVIKDMFENAWNEGRDAGVSELPVKIRKDPAVQDLKTFNVANWDYLPFWADMLSWDSPEVRFDAAQCFLEHSHDKRTFAPMPYGAPSLDYANAFEPTEALQAFDNRAWLIKDVIDTTLQNLIRYELFEHIKGGRTLNETINNIRLIFEPWIGDPTKLAPGSDDLLQAYRIENIVRTETTWAYNQGRVAIGEATGDYNLGFFLSAVLDERTTETCNAAHGITFRKDDRRAVKLIPPLHWQCRSVLGYVTTDDTPVEWTTEADLDEVIQLIPKGFH